jgi:hypothetical protein
MGCLKLTYENFESPLKVVFRKSAKTEKVVQRYMSLDPMQTKFTAYTPYNYALGNPIMFIDPDGRMARYTGGDDDLPWYFGSNSYGSKPVLTLGLHNISLPEYTRSEGLMSAPANILGGLWNGIATTYNEALAGKTGSQMMGESISGTENLIKRGANGDLNQADMEAGILMIVLRKGPLKGKPGSYSPKRSLPRNKHGTPKADIETTGAHTQLGQKKGRKGTYTQGREFDANGKPVKDIDFTDHGRSQNHTNPHQHKYEPNSTGGTPTRSKKSEPLK